MGARQVTDPVAVFIADVHVDNYARFGGPMLNGVNARAEMIFRAIEQAVGDYRATNTYVHVCGDLFNRSTPEPWLIERTQRAFDNLPRVHYLLGNHEQAGPGENHNALAPLHEPQLDRCVHDSPGWFNTYNLQTLCMPFRHGPIMEWLPQTVAEHGAAQFAPPRPTKPRVLVMHAGIADHGTPPYLANSSGAIHVEQLAKIAKQNGITHVFSGDWHRHQVWNIDGVTIVQVGALCPNRFPPDYEDAHIGPLVELYEDGAINVIDVPGPRFYKRRWSQIADDPAWEPVGEPAFVRITAREDQEKDAREWIDALRVRAGLTGGKQLGGVELEIDRAVSNAKARTASFEARQASSLDEALSVYVRSMPVPAGVEREQVIHHVKRLLG